MQTYSPSEAKQSYSRNYYSNDYNENNVAKNKFCTVKKFCIGAGIFFGVCTLVASGYLIGYYLPIDAVNNFLGDNKDDCNCKNMTEMKITHHNISNYLY